MPLTRIRQTAIGNDSITSAKLAHDLDLDGDFVRVPHGTTAERPSNPASGYMRFNTDLGTLEQWNTNTNAWAAIDSPPIINSLSYSGSVTAADTAGGDTITLNGSNFKTGFSVTVGGTTAPTVTYINSTQVTFEAPAKTAGDYDVTFTNANGLAATLTSGISYNGVPAFTTAQGSLGTIEPDVAMSTITIVAAEPDGGTLAYSVTSGSLPSGTSLGSANGEITGTPTNTTGGTSTSNFTVTATDDENQTNTRNFSLSVYRPVKAYDIPYSLAFSRYSYNNNGGEELIFPLTNSFNTWTYSVWMKHANTNTSSNTVNYFFSNSGANWGIFTDNLDTQYNPEVPFPIQDFNVPAGGNRGTHSSFSARGGDWFHLVLSCNNGTLTMYINGVQDPVFVPEGTISALSGNLIIGDWHAGGYNWRGYMAEIHFLPGQALTASTFGEVYNDSWVAKEVTGVTYDSDDGFYLPFSDNSSLANFLSDASGNGNNPTNSNSNFVVSDMSFDSPTNNTTIMHYSSGTVDTGVTTGLNRFAAYYSNGNYDGAEFNQSRYSGKWYFEVKHRIWSGSGNFSAVGIIPNDWHRWNYWHATSRLDAQGFFGATIDQFSDRYNFFNGTVGTGNVTQSFGNDDVWGFAYDLDAGKGWVSLNGTWLTGDPVAGTGAPINFPPAGSLSTGVGNTATFDSQYGSRVRQWIPVGQTTASSDNTNRSELWYQFGGEYQGFSATAGQNYGFKTAPPTGFKPWAIDNEAHYTNFSTVKGESPSGLFGVATYVGDGTNNDTKSVSTTCQPDMVWIKSRTNGSYMWRYYTPTLTQNGKQVPMYFGGTQVSNHYNESETVTPSSNAFTIGQENMGGSGSAIGGTNALNEDYVAIYWKLGGAAVSNPDGNISSIISANTDAGISSVKWTATQAAGTLGHGLGVTPDVAIVKDVTGSAAYNQWLWTRLPAGTSGGSYFFSGINNKDDIFSSGTLFSGGVNDTTVDFGAGGAGIYGNYTASDYQAIFFREVPGFSKFGFYRSNGNYNFGPVVRTGFRPKMVLIKGYNLGNTNWIIWTDQQDSGQNQRPLYLNLGNAEGVETTRSIQFLSDGFQVQGTNDDMNSVSTIGTSYFYMAFAAHPSKYSVQGFFDDFSTSDNL